MTPDEARHHPGGSMTNIDRAVARLRNAWDNAGPVPAYHHRTKAALHGTWPTLANAITALLAAADTPATVPPNTLAVGSEWDDADALTLACMKSELDQITVIDCDGYVHVWGAGAEWWQTGWPSYGCAPYTIIHTGRKADQ